MRIFLKILMWTAISLCALISFAFVAFVIYDGTFYRKELRKIQKQLNAMDGVTVLNMWGHRDITLEEISAAINIKGKGGMVIYDMWRDSKDSTDGLKWHSLEQIGNYSFTFYDSNGGVGPGFSKKDLENYTGLQLNTVQDLVDNYDRIYFVIDSLKQKDTLTHYLSDHYEFYLWIKDEDAQQVDPIFVLGNAKEGHDFARSLHWEYEDAYYNRYSEE